MWKKFIDYIDSRIRFHEFLDEKFRKYHVPRDVGLLSTLGNVAVVAFVIQAATGILLLIYYVPHPDHAFDSVQTIMNDVPYGWFFRQVHLIGSNVFVAVLFAHLVHVFLRAAYQKPRELTWLSGGLMLILVMLAGVTGYLLPWNQDGYWASTVLTTFPSVIPVVGDWITSFMRGGDSVSVHTLTRFFAFHVALFPILVSVFAVFHIFLVRRIGFSPSSHAAQEEAHGTEERFFYPSFFMKQIFTVLLYLAAIFFFMTFMPRLFFSPDSAIEANPLLTPDVIRPQWFFKAPYMLIKLIPNNFFGVAVQVVFLAAILVWPFFDNIKERNILKRPYLLTLFIFATGLWFLLTTWGNR